MKRLVSFIMIALMCFGLSACSSNSLEKACEKADALVAEWHSDKLEGFIYKGEYISEHDGYATSIYMVTAEMCEDEEFEAMDAFSKDRFMTYMTNSLFNEELYPKLKEVFKEHDVEVMFVIGDTNGRGYSSVSSQGVEIHQTYY